MSETRLFGSGTKKNPYSIKGGERIADAIGEVVAKAAESKTNVYMREYKITFQVDAAGNPIFDSVGLKPIEWNQGVESNISKIRAMFAVGHQRDD